MKYWKSQSITDEAKTNLGDKGEEWAREYLKKRGYWLFQPDWMGFKDEKLICFEIKNKKRFLPPPFIGHGLDNREVKSRMKMYEMAKIPTLLMIKDLQDGYIYVGWLHKLEEAPDNKKFTTKNNIRIYSLDLFTQLPDFENPTKPAGADGSGDEPL